MLNLGILDHLIGWFLDCCGINFSAAVFMFDSLIIFLPTLPFETARYHSEDTLIDYNTAKYAQVSPNNQSYTIE